MARDVHFDHALPRPTGDEYVKAVQYAERVINLGFLFDDQVRRLALAFLAHHDDAGVIPSENSESQGNFALVDPSLHRIT